MTLVLIPSLAAVRPLLCCDVRFTPESGHFIDKLCHRFAPRLRTLAVQKSMSALPPRADIGSAQPHVRFVPIADICTTRGSTASGAKFPMGNPQ